MVSLSLSLGRGLTVDSTFFWSAQGGRGKKHERRGRCPRNWDKDYKCLQDTCILANHSTYFPGPNNPQQGLQGFHILSPSIGQWMPFSLAPCLLWPPGVAGSMRACYTVLMMKGWGLKTTAQCILGRQGQKKRRGGKAREEKTEERKEALRNQGR